MAGKLLSVLALALTSFAPVQAVPAAPENALKLIPTSQWGPVNASNPNAIELRVYEPTRIESSPAVILALHWCGSTGPEYFAATTYAQYADERGFIVLFPSSQKDNNCWDVATTATLTRNGGGDSHDLSRIIAWAKTTYNANPSKIFVTGTSSGCMMSNVMSATYPDLFNAMSCYSGVAAGCLAGSPGSSPWTADPTCANGLIVKTPAQWKAVAQAMYPGYTGSYPRVMTFHGALDDLVFPQNFQEQLKQWSAIHGVTLSQTKQDTPFAGYTYYKYGNGKNVVGYEVANVGHFVLAEEEMDLSWFGL
ncbi:Feruloyl esterase B [Podospora aff. communis PSN243]|uniref:Carboxylic ester hydrolase n=1 Tax=Podospora aff. communis PSN243 TaxID=3040156 RepID=A0AAV9H2Q9_9PEZI|nr:Feruloyl esterase B [Podospora aff. communis PSN243]